MKMEQIVKIACNCYKNSTSLSMFKDNSRCPICRHQDSVYKKLDQTSSMSVLNYQARHEAPICSQDSRLNKDHRMAMYLLQKTAWKTPR